jgi:hypothetical protein
VCLAGFAAAALLIGNWFINLSLYGCNFHRVGWEIITSGRRHRIPSVAHLSLIESIPIRRGQNAIITMIIAIIKTAPTTDAHGNINFTSGGGYLCDPHRAECAAKPRDVLQLCVLNPGAHTYSVYILQQNGGVH